MQGDRSTQKQCEEHLVEAAKSPTRVRSTHDHSYDAGVPFCVPTLQTAYTRLPWDGDWDDEPAKLRTDLFRLLSGNVQILCGPQMAATLQVL
jgi:hypothetical protein